MKKRNQRRTGLLLGMVEAKFVVEMREKTARGICKGPEWT